jgi:putative transposase
MTGHDYQRVHAQMLAQFTADSQRRPKITANNKALRQRERLVQKTDIAEQFQERMPKPSASPLPTVYSDDDFSPAPRRGLT